LVFVVAQSFAQAFDLLLDGTHGRYTRSIANYRQPVLIYNPTAGQIRRNTEGILQSITGILSGAGWHPQPLATEAPGDATRLAREAVERGADLILVLGGDGTINEVVNGMAHSSAVLGVLPGGTANVFAMETGLGSRLARAAERLTHAVERRIALGRFSNDQGDRYFLLMGGVGLDASIVLDVNPELKAKAGKLAYWLAGFGQMFQSVPQFEARMNGTHKPVTQVRAGFTLVSRVKNYGGDLEIARKASLLRDDFEVVTFEGSHGLRYAGYFVGVGAQCLRLLPGVTDLHTDSVECSADVPVQLDGEYAGRTPGRFEIVKDSLNLLLPSAYR
jgi:YegS/Rv2252/BmrU family lipid kinase